MSDNQYWILCHFRKSWPLFTPVFFSFIGVIESDRASIIINIYLCKSSRFYTNCTPRPFQIHSQRAQLCNKLCLAWRELNKVLFYTVIKCIITLYFLFISFQQDRSIITIQSHYFSSYINGSFCGRGGWK